ncbi:MAG: glycosyltransferase family 4 protein [Candidatus Brennerbacteria bacterium]
MKLAILINRAGPTNARLFRTLAEEPGVSLSVYYCSDVGVGKRDFDPGFNRAIDWGTDFLSGYRYRFLTNFLAFNKKNDAWLLNPGIVWKLFSGDFDCVIVYGWNSPTQWLAFAAAAVRGIRILVWGENPLNQELAKRITTMVLLKRFILRRLFKNVDAFLYIGKQNKDFYRFFGVPEGKLFFTPYATDNARCEEAYRKLSPSRDRVRASLGISEDSIAILFVGRLIHKKNPGDLLCAYEILVRGVELSAPPPTLIFVGDGVLRGQLEKEMKNRRISNVHFKGFKGKEDLYPYFIAADVFVLPSGIGETWGLVVNEAMCFGLPVIVPDIVGCAADLVHNGENGFTFSTGNVNALAEALKKLTENRELCRRFGERSRAIIAEYSQENDVKGIVGAVTNICKGMRS